MTTKDNLINNIFKGLVIVCLLGLINTLHRISLNMENGRFQMHATGDSGNIDVMDTRTGQIFWWESAGTHEKPIGGYWAP